MRRRSRPSPHRPNLLITIDSGRPGPRLGICGHLDTKPVGDAAAEWMTDPFTATTIGDRMYGLGTTDMKGAVAAMLVAGAAYAEVKDTVGGSLALILTADEEYGSVYGAEYLVRQDALDVDGIVLGEPSGVHADWEGIRIVSRGISCFKVRVFGTQIHSSISDQFPVVNAVEQMARLYCGFKERFRPRYPEHPLCGSGPTLNIGVKTLGGVGFGVNAGVAEFWSDVRTTPGMDLETFQQDVIAALEGAAAEIPGNPVRSRVCAESDLDRADRGAGRSPLDHRLRRCRTARARPGDSARGVSGRIRCLPVPVHRRHPDDRLIRPRVADSCAWSKRMDLTFEPAPGRRNLRPHGGHLLLWRSWTALIPWT